MPPARCRASKAAEGESTRSPFAHAAHTIPRAAGAVTQPGTAVAWAQTGVALSPRGGSWCHGSDDSSGAHRLYMPIPRPPAHTPPEKNPTTAANKLANKLAGVCHSPCSRLHLSWERRAEPHGHASDSRFIAVSTDGSRQGILTLLVPFSTPPPTPPWASLPVGAASAKLSTDIFQVSSKSQRLLQEMGCVTGRGWLPSARLPRSIALLAKGGWDWPSPSLPTYKPSACPACVSAALFVLSRPSRGLAVRLVGLF